MAEYRLIDSSEDLQKLAQELQTEPVIGVDTEADSFFHYFDKVCLIHAVRGIFLIRKRHFALLQCIVRASNNRYHTRRFWPGPAQFCLGEAINHGRTQ